jgi:4-oxalomesaconate tautomerase
VPGTAAPITLQFLDVAGSSCGSLLPTGAVIDVVDGVEVTCIDNGMPVVILRAADFGLNGDETPSQLEANAALVTRIEALRLALGPRMNLGDVLRKTVPKMCLVSPARRGGTLSTATFIPHRVHEAIGVLGAVSVATACAIPGTVASTVASPVTGGLFDIEHPTGFFTVRAEVQVAAGGGVTVRSAALLRTARKLMQGEVFIPAAVWRGP